MTTEHDFTVAGAQAAAARDTLASWVEQFLASPGSDNAELAEQLAGELHWWAGPVLLPINRMHRLAGPPGEPVLCPVDEDEWDDRPGEIAQRVDEGDELPPVILAARGDQLVLEDGNHRVEGLRQAGHRRAWAIVGFEQERDRDRFCEQMATT
jgi:hypothetical protein